MSVQILAEDIQVLKIILLLISKHLKNGNFSKIFLTYKLKNL
jgi:hypothetical protein